MVTPVLVIDQPHDGVTGGAPSASVVLFVTTKALPSVALQTAPELSVRRTAYVPFAVPLGMIICTRFGLAASCMNVRGVQVVPSLDISTVVTGLVKPVPYSVACTL